MRVELCEGRTPIPVLEEAVRDLPDSFAKIAKCSDVSDIVVYGDNCYGNTLVPRNASALTRLNPPAGVVLKPYENPEGRFVSFNYHGRMYTVDITNAKHLKLSM